MEVSLKRDSSSFVLRSILASVRCATDGIKRSGMTVDGIVFQRKPYFVKN